MVSVHFRWVCAVLLPGPHCVPVLLTTNPASSYPYAGTDGLFPACGGRRLISLYLVLICSITSSSYSMLVLDLFCACLAAFLLVFIHYLTLTCNWFCEQPVHINTLTLFGISDLLQIAYCTPTRRFFPTTIIGWPACLQFQITPLVLPALVVAFCNTLFGSGLYHALPYTAPYHTL